MTPPRKPMSYQEAIKSGFKNYCVFTGRAGLAEFWWFQLFTFLVGLVLIMAQKATGMDVFNILSSIFGLATLLPQLGLIWRRLHDTGRAGGWFFLIFIPIVGIIVLIWWWLQPSEQGPNRFGDPA